MLKNSPYNGLFFNKTEQKKSQKSFQKKKDFNKVDPKKTKYKLEKG